MVLFPQMQWGVLIHESRYATSVLPEDCQLMEYSIWNSTSITYLKAFYSHISTEAKNTPLIPFKSAYCDFEATLVLG